DVPAGRLELQHHVEAPAIAGVLLDGPGRGTRDRPGGRRLMVRDVTAHEEWPPVALKCAERGLDPRRIVRRPTQHGRLTGAGRTPRVDAERQSRRGFGAWARQFLHRGR